MSDSLASDRLARVLTGMRARGLAHLVLAGDAWRSDYLRFVLDITPMEGLALALVDAQGGVVIFTNHPEEALRLRVQCAHARVQYADRPDRALLDALAASGTMPGAASVGAAPHAVMPQSLGAVLSASLRPTTAWLDGLMVRKSPAEADAVARAVWLADEGYAVFKEAARPGRPEFELIAELEAWFRAQGCPENFMIMGAGGPEVRTMRPPGERRLAVGDLVTTELTPCMDGYYAQICRTLVIGQPTPAQLKAYAVYEEALAAGIAAVRPGNTHGDVARAQNDVFRRHGLAEYITSKYTRVRGHGVGLYVDGPHVLEDVDLVLEPDMTLIVHPNTYHPEAGYIVLGDTVRVTSTGCEVLTRTPRALASVPANLGGH